MSLSHYVVGLPYSPNRRVEVGQPQPVPLQQTLVPPLSAGITLKGLNQKIFAFYGHPAANRATSTRLGALAVDCVASGETQLVVIDSTLSTSGTATAKKCPTTSKD